MTFVSAESFQCSQIFPKFSTIINYKNEKKSAGKLMKKFLSIFDRISYLSCTLIQSSNTDNKEGKEEIENIKDKNTEILDLNRLVERNINLDIAENENENKNEIKDKNDDVDNLKKNEIDFKKRKKYFIYVDPLDDFGAATVAREKCAELGPKFHVLFYDCLFLNVIFFFNFLFLFLNSIFYFIF